MKAHDQELRQASTTAYREENDCRCRRFHLCQQCETEVLRGKTDFHSLRTQGASTRGQKRIK